MTSPTGKGVVGYRRPPEEHKFAKGKSGNPKGRPPKDKTAKQRSAAHTHLEDVILAEALRPIQVRENDEIVEMPMIQAVVRSMGVAAVKGSHKAQTTLTEMVQAVQTKRADELLEMFKSVVEYKQEWEEIFQEFDRRGEPRPEPVPHPDDLKLNFKTGTVKFNGPFTDDDKANWDQMLERRRAAIEEIDYLRKEMKRTKKYQQFYQDDIDHEQRLVDMIGGIFPDEQTRRQPGFDIDEWRAKNGALDAIRKRRRGRRRAKPQPKPGASD
jgi:hypothetical protein